MASNSKFVEVQTFNQLWIKAIVYIALVAGLFVTSLFLINRPLTFAAFIPLIISTLIFLLFKKMQLSVSIDQNKIEYKFSPFHFRNQVINRNEIDDASVIQYSPISEYGGWGIRYNFNKGKAFTTRGNYGLKVKLKNGKSVLLGTQQPDALQKFLIACPLSSGL